MLRGAIAAFVLALAPAVLLGQAPAADRLTLDLYWEYETVADPQASPDGSQIVYTRQGFDKLNDKRDSSLWIMNADGSRNRFLVRGGNARWPRSGDRIAYTSRRQTSIPPRSTRCSCASTAARTACTAWASTTRGRSPRRAATWSSARTRAAAPATAAPSAT